LPGSVEDRFDQEADVAVVDPGDGAAELDGDISGEAGSEPEHPLLPSGAGTLASGQGGDRGFPVDAGQFSAGICDAVRDVDEAPEVLTVRPRAVDEEQPGSGFERVESFGSGAERYLELRVGHGSPSAGCG